jgi:hypothetical protein
MPVLDARIPEGALLEHVRQPPQIPLHVVDRVGESLVPGARRAWPGAGTPATPRGIGRERNLAG